MHAAEKRAIIAMLATVEATIVQLKSLLLSNYADPQEIRVADQNPPLNDDHLSEDEERRLEIAMERDRKEMEDLDKKRSAVLSEFWDDVQIVGD